MIDKETLLRLKKNQGESDRTSLKKQETESLMILASKNIEYILKIMGVQFRSNDRYINCSCFIHGGDNPSGFSWLKDDQFPRGKWKCWTHHCEEENGDDIVGLIMSARQCSFLEAIQIIKEILDCPDINIVKNIDFDNLKKESKSKHCVIDEITKIYQKMQEQSDKDIVINEIGARGYEQFIEKYGIVYCGYNFEIMKNRIVFPVYDFNSNLVGFTGRTIGDFSPKWMHYGINFAGNLFNINHARSSIEKLHSIILVEGPFDVLKFVKHGINNVCGIFRCKLGYMQRATLLKLQVNNVLLFLDKDSSGKSGSDLANSILKEISPFYFNVIDFREKICAIDVDKMNSVKFQELVDLIPGQFKE